MKDGPPTALAEAAAIEVEVEVERRPVVGTPERWLSAWYCRFSCVASAWLPAAEAALACCSRLAICWAMADLFWAKVPVASKPAARRT